MADNDAPILVETSTVDCHAIDSDGLSNTQRDLIVEAPLLIVLAGQDAATLMCTPGDEEDLALGWLITEGIVESPSEVDRIEFTRDDTWGNVVRVTPTEAAKCADRLTGHRKVYSSCGICGYAAIREVKSCRKPFDGSPGRLSPAALHQLAELMRSHQRLFKQTGATHAAALAEVRSGLLSDDDAPIVREDIGRHNALDKVVGEAVRAGVPLGDCLLMLSGRVSFEMVAKATRAGIPNVAAISAPTGLAVELAREVNMFLAGFVRGKEATIYSSPSALIAAS